MLVKVLAKEAKFWVYESPNIFLREFLGIPEEIPLRKILKTAGRRVYNYMKEAPGNLKDESWWRRNWKKVVGATALAIYEGMLGYNQWALMKFFSGKHGPGFEEIIEYYNSLPKVIDATLSFPMPSRPSDEMIDEILKSVGEYLIPPRELTPLEQFNYYFMYKRPIIPVLLMAAPLILYGVYKVIKHVRFRRTVSR